MDPICLNTHVLHQVSKQDEFSTGIVITFQVMAFARMSAAYPHPIGPLT
jgi:hypothetical protein